MTERPNAKKPKPEAHQQLTIKKAGKPITLDGSKQRKPQEASRIPVPMKATYGNSMTTEEYERQIEADRAGEIGGFSDFNAELFQRLMRGKS